MDKNNFLCVFYSYINVLYFYFVIRQFKSERFQCIDFTFEYLHYFYRNIV